MSTKGQGLFLRPSPVQTIRFDNFSFYLKRDDLIHPFLSGNKARKLAFLLDISGIDRLISYGSLQSNAMLSLAYIAHLKGWRFDYHARIDEALLAAPKGNLRMALCFGMRLQPLETFTYYESRNELSRLVYEGRTLVVPEGGRCKEAAFGLETLAQEIEEWARAEGIEPTIFLPSGTGTTALFLKKHLPYKVVTVACVGGSSYLKKQFKVLMPDEKFHPFIVEPPKKYRFGRLYKELFELWQALKSQTGVEFDLLYDPVGFATLLYYRPKEPILYIHQGGVLGNETMIARYKAKFGKITQT